MAKKKRKGALTTSEQFKLGAGIGAVGGVVGLSSAGQFVRNKKTGAVKMGGFNLGKLHGSRKMKAFRAVATAAGLVGTVGAVQKARDQKGAGSKVLSFVGDEFTRSGGAFLGSVAASIGTGFALSGAGRLARGVKKAKSAARAARAGKPKARRGDVKFVRIGGRVVPIRKKK